MYDMNCQNVQLVQTVSSSRLSRRHGCPHHTLEAFPSVQTSETVRDMHRRRTHSKQLFCLLNVWYVGTTEKCEVSTRCYFYYLWLQRTEKVKKCERRRESQQYVAFKTKGPTGVAPNCFPALQSGEGGGRHPIRVQHSLIISSF